MGSEGRGKREWNVEETGMRGVKRMKKGVEWGGKRDKESTGERREWMERGKNHERSEGRGKRRGMGRKET